MQEHIDLARGTGKVDMPDLDVFLNLQQQNYLKIKELLLVINKCFKLVRLMRFAVEQ
jgi:hypothetical protein